MRGETHPQREYRGSEDGERNRRKSNIKNPPEDAPSAEGPSGQGTSGGPPSALPPSADEAPGIAPTRRPDASLAQDLRVEQDRSVERDLTEERIVCPQDEIRARDAQLHPAQVHSARSPSAVDAGGEEVTVAARQADDGDVARPHSPTALDILAGSSEAAGAPAAAEHADISQPHPGQSPTHSMATEILNSEDDEEGGSTESVSGSGSTEEEEEELVGAPAAALCEQVVPLLRYLDRKMEKYADPRQPGSYVELVRRRTRTKVHTSKLLARVDQELKALREKHECLWGQYTLNKKVYKHFDRVKDGRLEELAKEQVKLTEALDSEQAQNRILSEELVRQTRASDELDT
ncbi:hypothetical protein AXG93_242s1060 [Marchantia polymorpha subsp. ruderalis]|uniref:Uncharacterized protein n=1 Tax=Marchantia polymorpha subsp. ruderalis TaxID=1480154 RepID=A0A176VPN4_MARPO|nr:hypothetical protein AXG93_242s1060 [Marchantia polymorpha subsp. ruderalis]